MSQQENKEMEESMSIVVADTHSYCEQMDPSLKHYFDQLSDEICCLKKKNNKLMVENMELKSNLKQKDADLATFIAGKAKKIVGDCDLDKLINKQQQIRATLSIYDREVLKRLQTKSLCRICMKKYNHKIWDGRNKIVIVPCGHCICKQCLLSSGYRNEFVTCPHCGADVVDTCLVRG